MNELLYAAINSFMLKRSGKRMDLRIYYGFAEVTVFRDSMTGYEVESEWNINVNVHTDEVSVTKR